MTQNRPNPVGRDTIIVPSNQLAQLNAEHPDLETVLLSDPAFNRQFANLKKIGDGAFGEVFRADDLALGRPVAIKVLVRGLGAASGVMRRFRREFATIARLRYPGVIQVHSYGTVIGLPYFSMELLEGCTFRDETLRLTGGKGVGQLHDKSDTLRQLLAIFRQCLAALGYVHFHRVIHRDIKPENIWITPSGRVKLLDFGLVLPLDRSISITGSDYFLGTLNYVAPEQIEGDDIDGRADLYSLATVIYEALAGALPFQSIRGLGMLHLKITQRPRPLRSYWSDVDADLDQIILRMLDPDPAKRFGTAEQVGAALAPTLAKWGVTLTNGDTFSPQPERGPHNAPLFLPQFVGREDILQRLDSLIARANGCQLVLLDGAEGMGKTRLLLELRRRHLFDSTLFLHVYPNDTQAAGSPAERVVWELAVALAQVGCDRLRQAPWTPVLIDAFPQLKKIASLTHLPAPSPLDPPAARDRLIHAILDLLCACGQERTLVLAVDDLTAADSETTSLLRDVARRLLIRAPLVQDHGNILLILSRRTDGSDQFTAWQSLTAGGFNPDRLVPLELTPLSEGEAAMLVQSMLGLDCPPVELAAEMNKQCGGVPLYIEESIRGLVDELWLRHGADGWRAGSSDVPLASRGVLPVHEFAENITTIRRLREIFDRRLSELTPDAKRLCLAAAVLGQCFKLDHLIALSEDSGESVLMALDEMVHHRILTERQQSASLAADAGRDEALYRFSNRPLWQVAYHKVPAEQKRALHLRAAALLRQDNTAAVAWDSVAHHLVNAGETKQALDLCLMAAELPDIKGTQRAIPYLRSAVRLGRELGQEARLVPAMYELAQALSINPQTTEANELYLDVIRLGGPPLILGGAYAELGSYCFHKRDFNQCREYLTRSRELLDPLPFAPEKAALHFHWAQVLRESGEVEAAARECLAGLAQLPDATPSPAVSRLNNCLGLCYWHQGKLDLAEERINLALEHAINAGHTSLHIAAINSLAALLWTRGKVDLALAQVETGIDLARQAMAFQNLKLLLLNACFFHNKLGNPQTARKHATEYLDISRSTGDKFNEAKALMELGNAMEKLQKYADAQSYHERGLAIMIEIGNEQEQAYCHANLGCLHQRAGRWSDALAELDVARDMLLHIDDQYGAGETIRRIAEVHLARGNIDQAEQVANTARTLLEKLQTVEELLWLDIITAQIQVVHGQLAEARDIFVRVIEQSQQLKSAEIEGVALRNLALVYYRLGEFDAAQDAIRRSISMFDLHHNTAELGKSYAAAGLIFSQGRTQPDPSLF